MDTIIITTDASNVRTRGRSAKCRYRSTANEFQQKREEQERHCRDNCGNDSGKREAYFSDTCTNDLGNRQHEYYYLVNSESMFKPCEYIRYEMLDITV